MPIYKKIRLPAKTISRFGLLDTEYPVPVRNYIKFVTGDGCQLDMLLYWLQEYSTTSPNEWEDCEPAMQRLSELLAPRDTNPEDVFIEGHNWSLLVGKVDLTKTIVTIQRNNHLLAAIQNHGTGRLVASAYRPLDKKSANYLVGLAMNPAHDGTVCMRPSNWEYALDCSAGMGNMYAAERGEPYLSYWQQGLGISNDGTAVEEWLHQQSNKPIVAKNTAFQIGTCYVKTPNSQATQRKCSYTDNWSKFMADTKWARDTFFEHPSQWGLRGDPFLWDALRKSFMTIPPPHSSKGFVALLKSEFKRMVGVPITHDSDVYVEEFAHGGMSSGYISLSFWRERGIPMLQKNFESKVLG